MNALLERYPPMMLNRENMRQNSQSCWKRTREDLSPVGRVTQLVRRVGLLGRTLQAMMRGRKAQRREARMARMAWSWCDDPGHWVKVATLRPTQSVTACN